MPNYNYSAINAKGRTIRGSLMAENLVDLEARLKEIDLDLINHRETKTRKAGMGARVQIKDLIMLCLHLEQLSRAAVPIHEALADVRDATDSPKLRDVMAGVLETVKNGTTLSDSIAIYPRVFDSVFVGLIKAGEKNGNLTESFMQMADHLKWTNDLRRKVKKAMRYPIALLLVMSGVIAILMTAVVPKLIKFILDQGFEVPFHTKALIAVSEAFQGYWYVIFGVPVGLFILVKVLNRTSEKFAYRFDSLALRMPIIGPVVRKINMARFTHFFSVMYKSGIHIPEALLSAKDVVNNRVIAEAVDVVHRSVIEGNSLTASLRISNQFPNLVVRMFKVGEDSGNLNESLENVNFFYNREVNDSVDNMVGMIQPLLTIVMGALIFWVIAAVFGPLYQSFSKMKF
jgi:type IV pilus assembly protein PilC